MTQIGNGPPAGRAVRPWLTWIALAAIWCAVFIDLAWIYALLFLAWGLYDLVTGESVFLQRITRRHQPVTYWVVVATWILFGVLGFLYLA